MKLTLFLYRLGRWFYTHRIPLYPITNYITRFLCSCWCPAQAKIGKNFQLGYGGLGTVIHHNTIIGDNVTVSQHATIGRNFGDKDVPKIGNDVYVGKGALLFGEIIIGNNVIIGGHTVVNKSIPSNCTVVGNPFRIVEENRTETYHDLDNKI